MGRKKCRLYLFKNNYLLFNFKYLNNKSTLHTQLCVQSLFVPAIYVALAFPSMFLVFCYGHKVHKNEEVVEIANKTYDTEIEEEEEEEEGEESATSSA